jgi:hypothetical protein
MIDSYAKIVTTRPLVFLLTTVIVTIVAVFGATGLSFRSDYKVYFADDDPRRVAFESVQNEYAPNDNIVVVLHTTRGSIVDTPLLEAASMVVDGGWRLPFASRVDSITNFQYAHADGDDVVIEDLAADPSQLENSHRQAVLDTALAEPMLVNRLISPSGDTLGVNINFLLPEDPQDARAALEEIAGEVRALANEVRSSHPDFRVGLTGILMQNRAFVESSQQDSQTLYPLMLLVIGILCLLTLRSVWGAISASAVIILSALTAVGLWGWLGYSLNNTSIVAPVIIVTIAVADSIHILTLARQKLREGLAWRDAVAQSLAINFVAVTITSATTIIGYTSLSFSDAPPIRELGVLTAIGVAAAWFFSLVFLPALASLLPVKVRGPGQELTGRVAVAPTMLAGFIQNRRMPILAVFLIGGIAAAVSVPRIELDDDFVKYFDETIEFRRDTDFATAHLTGPYVVQFSLDSGAPDGVTNPAYLERVDAFKTWLEEQPEVIHALAITDVIKRLNRVMNEDAPEAYRVPNTQPLAAQYLFLYELSLPFGLDLNNQINVDRSASRLSLSLKPLRSRELQAFAARAESWLRENTPVSMHAEAVGPILMFAHISQTNIDAMMTGNVLAILLIAATIMGTLRSVRLGLLALLVNALPLVLTLGVWSVSVGVIGMASSILTATSLGIIVDDTVHFLIKFKRAAREAASPRQALEATLSMAGRAIVSTSIILMFGFALLVSSSFLVNKHMGLLTSMTVGFALATDLLLLPALVLLFWDRTSPSRKPAGSSAAASRAVPGGAAKRFQRGDSEVAVSSRVYS